MSSLTVRPERSSQRAESQEKVKCQICQNSLCRHCNPVGRWAFQCSRIAWHTISYFHLFLLLLLCYLRLAIKRAWVAWGSTIACIRLAPCDKIRDVKFLVFQGPLAHALYSLAKSHLSELRSFARHLPPVASTKSSARSLHKNIQTWRKCWRVLFSKARKCLRRTQFDSFECILEFVWVRRTGFQAGTSLLYRIFVLGSKFHYLFKDCNFECSFVVVFLSSLHP